jgi:hypothetical protein
VIALPNASFGITARDGITGQVRSHPFPDRLGISLPKGATLVCRHELRPVFDIVEFAEHGKQHGCTDRIIVARFEHLPSSVGGTRGTNDPSVASRTDGFISRVAVGHEAAGEAI